MLFTHKTPIYYLCRYSWYSHLVGQLLLIYYALTHIEMLTETRQSFYRAANAVFAKVDRIASENVTLQN